MNDLPDYKLDPPADPKSVACDWCDGTGKIGCTRYCSSSDVEREICRASHGCNHCKGHGRVEMSTGDWKNEKAEQDFDNRRETERGL